MSTSAMLWGGAAYNNGILPFKRPILGESYTEESEPAKIVTLVGRGPGGSSLRTSDSETGEAWIAAPTAAIAYALIAGSRRRHQAMAIVAATGEPGAGQAAMLLLDLGRGRILGHSMPSLSPQERVGAGRHFR